MAQTKSTYQTVLSLPLSLSNSDQQYIFEEIFFEVMSSHKSKSKEERSRWEYVFDYDIYHKLWSKLSLSLQKAFTDLVLSYVKTPAELSDIMSAVKDGDNLYVPKARDPIYRQWFIDNCMDILDPLIDKVIAQNKKDEERESYFELKKAINLIPLLEKSGYVVTKSAAPAKKAPTKKVAAKKAPAKKAKAK